MIPAFRYKVRPLIQRACIAAMLDGRNDIISLIWKMKSIFKQKCFVVPTIQHMAPRKPSIVQETLSDQCFTGQISPLISSLVIKSNQ